LYIIKIKGRAKIPDYIQLRDDSYVLVEYFRADRPHLHKLEKYGFKDKEGAFIKLIEDLPFGEIKRLEL